MDTTTEAFESFQIPLEAAEFYESAFVPAFFAQWAPVLCEAAGIGSGQSLLDVACGTGIVARTAADLVAPDGTIVGVDLNEALLNVARRVRPGIDFRQGRADNLPFPDESFNTVLCQMALMFFPDRGNSAFALLGLPDPSRGSWDFGVWWWGAASLGRWLLVGLDDLQGELVELVDELAELARVVQPAAVVV